MKNACRREEERHAGPMHWKGSFPPGCHFLEIPELSKVLTFTPEAFPHQNTQTVLKKLDNTVRAHIFYEDAFLEQKTDNTFNKR